MTDMSGKTKAELLEYIEELQGKLSQSQVALQKASEKEAGWLITTPIPWYEGVAYGVRFFQGQAFIGKDQVVPSFEFQPLKDTEMAKYSAEEQVHIRQRERIPSSERAAQAFRSEFGYKVVFYGPEDKEALRQHINDRAMEYAQSLERMRSQTADAELAQPGYMGG